MNILSVSVNRDKFDHCIDMIVCDKSFNGNTRLMTSNKTIKELTGAYFYDNRLQTYRGIPFIQNESLEFGEVAILTQRM
jgi:hypothetical protein